MLMMPRLMPAPCWDQEHHPQMGPELSSPYAMCEAPSSSSPWEDGWLWEEVGMWDMRGSPCSPHNSRSLPH